MTTVRTMMTPGPHTIGFEQSVGEATRRMRAADVRHLPVLAGGRLVGLISERDARLVEQVSAPDDVSVGDVMSTEPFVVGPDDDLRPVVDTMAARKLGSAVVLEHEEVIGIFTTTDALHLLLRHLASASLRGF